LFNRSPTIFSIGLVVPEGTERELQATTKQSRRDSPRPDRPVVRIPLAEGGLWVALGLRASRPQPRSKRSSSGKHAPSLALPNKLLVCREPAPLTPRLAKKSVRTDSAAVETLWKPSGDELVMSIAASVTAEGFSIFAFF
jgi:hypothetical protein